MSRIKMLSIDELQERGVDVSPFLKDFAELPGSVATLGHRPDILQGTLGLWQAVMGAGTLPAELKYLSGYLASMSAGCLYCSAHTASNAAQGAGSEKVAAVWDYERSPLFSEAERAALRFAQLAGQAPSGVQDEDVAELKRHYSETEIVEHIERRRMKGGRTRLAAQRIALLQYQHRYVLPHQIGRDHHANLPGPGDTHWKSCSNVHGQHPWIDDG